MKTLVELAREHKCLVSVDTNAFQRRARILQALWRESRGYPIGEYRGREIGSYLAMPWAEQTMANFLDDEIREVVRKALEAEYGEGNQPLIESTRMYSNLLSSQPLAFNLFARLHLDLDLASEVMHLLSAGRMARVTAVDFEYSPGRGDEHYTGDRSAFDVYVCYLTPEGRPGFVGIEVKYHENLANKASQHRPRYDEVAEMMGCFLPAACEQLRQKPLQQIWRDHLLAGIHRIVDRFADGFFVFLSPAGNDAVADYRQCLTNEDTFTHWTLEAVVAAIGRCCNQPWVVGFTNRYLAFEKLDASSNAARAPQ